MPAVSTPSAEIILHCSDLEQTLAFYTEQLGFKVAMIFPADAPEVAVLSAYGIKLRLVNDGLEDASTIRISRPDQAHCRLQAPNGSTFEFVSETDELVLPNNQQQFVINYLKQNTHWHTGRAGMRYRDLIPERQGGRFIASHIHIPTAGPVADYVHYHKIRFQMIYCYKGWVKVVYEDQGEPFVLQAGDCVLQPPLIRHQVLESSENLEVVEIGCPAEHLTYADLELELPTRTLNRQRDFSGQHFVRHQCKHAIWQPWRLPGFEMRDIGIAKATAGLAGAYVIRPQDAGIKPVTIRHQEEFLFFFILHGDLTLSLAETEQYRLEAGSSCTIPANMPHTINSVSPDLEILEVRLAADFSQTLLTTL